MNDTTANTKIIELTEEGHAELVAELAELKEVKLPEAIQRVADAREYGDLSENSEYHNARDDKELIETRIAEIEAVLSQAKVVKTSTSTKQVGLGSHVTIAVSGKKNKKRTIQIVGEYQADPAEGKISKKSPLGSALFGKKKGDSVTVKAPAGDIEYKILEIK